MHSLIRVSVKRRLGLRVGSGSGSVVASHFFSFLFFFFFFLQFVWKKISFGRKNICWVTTGYPFKEIMNQVHLCM